MELAENYSKDESKSSNQEMETLGEW
jgi:hypothetical protein